MSGIMAMVLGAKTAIAAAVDEFFNRVTLLLPGNGTNGAQNNTFLDSSSNNFTITRNGNTTQGTFSPFSQTGWSVYFDGTDDCLNIPSGPSQLAFGTGDFCIEFFFSVSAGLGSDIVLYDSRPSNSNGVYPLILINASSKIIFNVSSADRITGTTTVSVGTWYHVAVTRSGTSTKLFVNGVQEGSTYSDSNNYLNGSFRPILATSGFNNAVAELNGYLSNVRVVKGSPVYTANFSTPTSPLTAITNTQLLTCQDNRFVDASSNNFTLGVTGTPSVQAFSPFAPTAAYSAATNGGSAYFDGAGDYLSTPDNAAFDLGTGDFTFECWVYKPNNNDGAFICSAGNGLEISYVSGSLRIGRLGVAWDVTQLYTIPQNAWTHIAFTKASGRTYIFANGSLLNAGGTANTNTYDTTTTLYVGVAGDTTSRIFNGYMAGVRLIKGQSLATANFTPPTAPITTSSVGWTGAASSITGTVSLLLNYTNAGITDATGKNVLETVGNAQISTTQSKFGGSSMYFDGTDDRLFQAASNQNIVLGTGDFTVEAWAYHTSRSTNRGIFQITTSNTGLGGVATGLSLLIQTDGKLNVYANGATNGVSTTTTTVALNTWFHFALVRSGGVLKLYLDGSLVTDIFTSGSLTDTFNYTGSYITVGGSFATANLWSGYIDDFRISKFARYTGNFTPPTAAFALQ